jgi:hypothetical protein
MFIALPRFAWLLGNADRDAWIFRGRRLEGWGLGGWAD